MTLAVQSEIFEAFRSRVDAILCSHFDRRTIAESFLTFLQLEGIRLSEADKVIMDSRLLRGAGTNIPSALQQWQKLTEEERSELRQHLARRVEQLRGGFPELVQKFPEQFS